VNHFVGRDTEMEQLEEFFQPGSLNPSRRRVYVIHGLGGIGKTQLAIEYARKYHKRYNAVFWLDGSSKDSLYQSLAKIAHSLPKDELTADTIKELQYSKIDVNAVARGTIQWLSLPSNQHWLLIFDNVDRDHNLKEDTQAYDVKDFFPSDHGSILITSRLLDLRQYGTGLKLGILNDKESIAILENNAHRSIRGRSNTYFTTRVRERI
jgi:hypothetical protein